MEDRLRKFATLVEAGNFTRAALALHISQPALTVSINKLERELGAQLLVRGPRKFILTPAGELAYRSAKQLMVTTTNLATSLRDLAGDQASATIGLIDSLASMLFTTRSHANEFDNLLKMSVIVNNSRFLLRAIVQDEVDLAFITEQTGPVSELLSVESVGVEPLVLVCHPDQKTDVETQLRHRQPVDFISYDQPSTSFRLIQASLKQRGINTTPIFYSSSPEIMVELVLRAKGMSVLPYFLVRPLLAIGRLHIVKHPDTVLIDRPISSVMRKSKVLPTGLVGLSLLVQNLLEKQTYAARQ